MLITLVVTSLITIVLIIVGLAFYLISVLIDDSDDDGGAIIGLGLDSQDFNSTPVASPNDVPRWANNGSRPRQLHYAATTATNTTTMEPESCNCTRAWEEGTAVTIRGKTTVEGSGSMRSGMEADHSFDGLEATNDSSSEPFDNAVSPEDIQSAELNSRLFKVSEQQRELAREEGPDEESALDQLEETTFEGATGAPAEANSGSPASGVAPPQKTGRAPGNKGRTETGAVAWQDEAPVAQKNRIITQLGATIGKQIVDDFDLREVQLGGTGLHWCKTRSSLDKLVKLGVPLELLNRRKETALHVAIRRHKLPVLIGLLVNGANIECRNGHDESPLMVACKVRNIFAVQMLLIFEANYDATDRFGHSARHYTSVICERNKSQNQQVPSAAHLILAMLNEIGAKRCPQKLATASKSLTTTTTRSTLSATNDSSQGSRGSQTSQGKSLPSSLSPPPSTPASITQARQQEHHHSPPTNPQQTGSLFEACCEGCSANGIYNGNSYNRWPNFKRESLYKRHMFDDIIETKLTEALQQRRNRKRNPTTKISRLLCIDGGGLRGVIVCQILIEMEKYLKRPMVSYFDWIGGTSVGAFIACALCIGVPLKELRQICFDVKDEVFAGGRPYNSKHLERVLRRTFGNTTRFSEVKDRHLAVTTVLADREPCQLRLFRNYDSPSRLLERYGYAADTFNNLSGHSIVTEWSKAGNKGSNKANGKQAAKVTVASSNAIPKPESRVSTANQPVDTNRTNSISSNSATAKQPLTTTTTSDGREADNNQAGSVIDEQQSRKTTVKMSSDTDQTCTTHAAANNEMIVRDKSKPDAGGRKESTAAKESTVSANNANQQQEAILEENDPDPIIWKTVRASTAAPFFFKPYGPYLDGGIISNNPTLDMLNEFESYQKVRKFLRKHVKRSDIPDSERSELGSINEATSKLSLVVSLGTGKGRVIGRQTMIDFGQVASGFATVFSPIELVRSIRAARDFFKKLMQQSCHTDDYILDRAQAWCSSLGIPYFRINPPLTTIFSIDDKRDEQLVNALWQTKLYMRAMKDQLNELADILDGTDQI